MKMLFLKYITSFAIFIVGCETINSELSEIIQKIRKESDTKTICFYGIDNAFLTVFSKSNIDVAMVIFTPFAVDEFLNINYNAILVLQMNCKIDEKFEIVSKIIMKIRVRKFVVILADSLENLYECFHYLERNKFTRIFGIVRNISYAFLPFEFNSVRRLVKENRLPDPLKNFNGYAFRTTIQKDIPRTFWYPDDKGKPQIGGTFGQVLDAFLQRHNASFKEISLNNSTKLCVPCVVNSTLNNIIDIAMNVFNPVKNLDFSYPVKTISWTIMIPLNGYVNPNQYFLKPFCFKTWVFLGMGLLFIICMDVLKDIYMNINVDLWQSLSRTFLAMLGSPSERPPTRSYRFHGQVLIFAFILRNIYYICFTSFLTVFIKVKQFDTIQDLIDNNFPVMMPGYEWDLISDYDLHPVGFENIVSLVEYPVYISEMNSMRNTSFAYGVGSDRSEFLIRMQKFHSKPLFSNSNGGLFDCHIGFLLEWHSPIKDILNKFIIELLETGLITKWDRDSVYQGLRAGFGIGHRNDDGSRRQPMTLHHLEFAWNCMLIGFILAAVVLIVEILIAVCFCNLKK